MFSYVSLVRTIQYDNVVYLYARHTVLWSPYVLQKECTPGHDGKGINL